LYLWSLVRRITYIKNRRAYSGVFDGSIVVVVVVVVVVFVSLTILTKDISLAAAISCYFYFFVSHPTLSIVCHEQNFTIVK